MNYKNLIEFDKKHIWHPYSSAINANECYIVSRAYESTIELIDGTKLIDGMSSWWSAIHGYNVKELNNAAYNQLSNMSHVMFGGLTHEPAIKLSKLLLEINDNKFNNIFFSDSGSVSVEVAMKMALQYWNCKGNYKKKKFATFRGGYHGDTWNAMSVCDPVIGMHKIFNNILTEQIFAPIPICKINDEWNDSYFDETEKIISENHEEIAAFIVEPIVQGAGGMRFYHINYLKKIKELCLKYEIILIFDEIATGFGRTGNLFAYQFANVDPDILCLGKALTGGYISLAATLCTSVISETISKGNPGVFMHGPTFMANPLACSIAYNSIELLLNKDWKKEVKNIESEFYNKLSELKNNTSVSDVRILGAIGVIEMKENVNVFEIQKKFIKHGVWLRPFGKLIYTMPPFNISNNDLQKLTNGIKNGIIEFYKNV